MLAPEKQNVYVSLCTHIYSNLLDYKNKVNKSKYGSSGKHISNSREGEEKNPTVINHAYYRVTPLTSTHLRRSYYYSLCIRSERKIRE